MCKFEFKTYKQKKETIETFEDSVCNGIPKGRRMLKKAFEDNAECAEFWLHGDPNESGEYRRSVLVFAFDMKDHDTVSYFVGQKWHTKKISEEEQKQPFYLCKETVKTDGEILIVATCGRRSNV